ncbi:unnamed protein product, partial [Staurois parvus]
VLAPLKEGSLHYVSIRAKPCFYSPHGPWQGQTDNSWGPWAIADHGAPCPCPH